MNDELRALEALEADQPHSEKRDRVFAEIEAGRARLHSIEWALYQSLRDRPLDSWCTGCFRVIDALHRKATTEEPCAQT